MMKLFIPKVFGAKRVIKKLLTRVELLDRAHHAINGK